MGLGMSGKIRKALAALGSPADGRRKRWRNGSSLGAIGLLASGVLLGTFLGFAQPGVAGEPSVAADDYAVLRAFVLSDTSASPIRIADNAQAPDDSIHSSLHAAGSATSAPDLNAPGDGAAPNLVGSDASQVPNDSIHSSLRKKHPTMELVSPTGEAKDDYSVLKDFGQSTDSDQPTATIDDKSEAPRDSIHSRLRLSTASDAIDVPAAPNSEFAAIQEFAKEVADADPTQVAAAAADAKPAKVKKAAPTKKDDGPATYVGSQACEKCHRNQGGSFLRTPMGEIFMKNPRNAEEKQGCESCHGPGSKHINSGGDMDSGEQGDIISFRKDSPRPVAERNAICLGCHEKGDRTNWSGSTHDTRGLACTDCHQVMEKISPKNQLIKNTEAEVCFQCHKDKRAQEAMSNHMPILEGKMTCSDCHNPHGSATDSLLKEASVNETCYKCHADKRGPFLWEHEPVRDNCLNCHQPHGTAHEHLLKVQTPMLCRECHAGVGHSQPGNPTAVQEFNRACLNCHTKVHGSNSPAGELFQR